MSVANQNNPQLVIVPIGAVAANTTFKAFKLSKEMHIKSIHMLDVTGVPADDTDYVTVAIKQGSTTLLSLSSALTGGDGALPANGWLTKSASDLLVPAGAVDVAVGLGGAAELAAGAKLAIEIYG